MERASVSEKFGAMVANELGIFEDQIKDGATFISLGGDSIATTNLILAVETEFGIEIPDEDAESLDTVGKTIDYIHKNAK